MTNSNRKIPYNEGRSVSWHDSHSRKWRKKKDRYTNKISRMALKKSIMNDYNNNTTVLKYHRQEESVSSRKQCQAYIISSKYKGISFSKEYTESKYNEENISLDEKYENIPIKFINEFENIKNYWGNMGNEQRRIILSYDNYMDGTNGKLLSTTNFPKNITLLKNRINKKIYNNDNITDEEFIQLCWIIVDILNIDIIALIKKMGRRNSVDIYSKNINKKHILT